ncbi:hypothetical protein DAVIS_00263 [Mycobacterium marinum]|uniref:Uncharacterized protein n=1 Tax=Mycobacterium marinum TaxID=1781 RepID=A0A3E2N2G5_MYCMR|nr:hypothetical protein [Mycobacterium marinum]RFZ47551.1 hypothetical protein DAVIS_00263 [Mycobacterium marinum]
MSQPRPHACLKCEPWLCQGDIFGNTRVLDYPDIDGAELVPQLRVGQAMLVTHDCALDKMNRKGQHTIERLAFVRIRNVEELPSNRAEVIRSSYGKVQPYEAQYLGVIPDIGESYVLVSDPYFLPVKYFGAKIELYPDEPEPNRHLTISRNDSRRFRLSDSELEMFRIKWNVQWTRAFPRQL